MSQSEQLPNAVEVGAQQSQPEELDNLLGGLAEAIGQLPSDDDPESRAQFYQYVLKVAPCPRRGIHEWSSCAYSHPGEKAARRDPLNFSYAAIACASMKQKGTCARGDSCPYAHSAWEYWLHPQRYHTALCSKGENCTRQFCFFAHSATELRASTVRQRVPSASALSVAATDWSLPKGSPTFSNTTQAPLVLQSQGRESQQQAQQPAQQAQQQAQQAQEQAQQQQQQQQAQQAVRLQQAQQQNEPTRVLSGSTPQGWQLASSSMQPAALGLGSSLAGSSIWGGDLALGLCRLQLAGQSTEAGASGASTATIPQATSNPANLTALHLTQDGTTQAVLQALVGQLALGGMDAAQAAAVLTRLLPPSQPQLQLTQAVRPVLPPAAIGFIGSSQSSAECLPWDVLGSTPGGSGAAVGGLAVQLSWGHSNV